MIKLKFSDFQANESIFIQLDTIKGFSYLDNVGAIINSFYQGKQPLSSQIINGQVHIFQPLSGIIQIRVDGAAIWANLSSTTDIKPLLEFFQGKVVELNKLLGFDGFSRIGVKTQFAHFFASDHERKEFFDTLIPKKFEEVALIVSTKLDARYSARLELFPIINTLTTQKGMSVDIDIFATDNVQETNIVGDLQQMHQKMPEAINKIIG